MEKRPNRQVEGMLRILQAYNEGKKIYRKYKGEPDSTYVDLAGCATADAEDLFDFSTFEYALEWDLCQLWFRSSFEDGQHDATVYVGPEDRTNVIRWIDNILEKRNIITSISIERRAGRLSENDPPTKNASKWVTRSNRVFYYDKNEDDNYVIWDNKNVMRYEVGHNHDGWKVMDIMQSKTYDIPFTFDGKDKAEDELWSTERCLAVILEYVSKDWDYDYGSMRTMTSDGHMLGAFSVTETSFYGPHPRAKGKIMGFELDFPWTFGEKKKSGPKNLKAFKHVLESHGIILTELDYEENAISK